MEEKLTQIAQNSLALHDRCHKNHYAAYYIGDGTAALTLQLPFEADTVQIICTDPRVMFEKYTVMFYVVDLSSLGYGGAIHTAIREGKLASNAMTVGSLEGRVQPGENGALTLNCLPDCIYGQDLVYKVVATKLTDKTWRQQYTEFVEQLTGSGTAHVCKAKIEAAFTAEEWVALKATRPNWIFEEV